MDLVDKQHVTRLQVSQDGRQITGTRNSRAARRLDLSAQLVGDNRGQRGLAQTRRARENHVVERLATALRRLDQHAKALLDMLLTAVVVQALGTQGTVDIEVLGCQFRAHHTLTVRHGCRRRVAGRRPQVLRVIGFPHHASIPSRLSAAPSRSSTRISCPSYPLRATSVSCGLKPMERSAARASSIAEGAAAGTGIAA